MPKLKPMQIAVAVPLLPTSVPVLLSCPTAGEVQHHGEQLTSLIWHPPQEPSAPASRQGQHPAPHHKVLPPPTAWSAREEAQPLPAAYGHGKTVPVSLHEAIKAMHGPTPLLMPAL